MALFDWIAGAAALGSTGAAIYGASQAGKAADAQVAGNDAAIAEQRRQYDLTRSDLAPYRAVGTNALAQLYDASGETFETSPGYQFRMDEGTKAVQRSAAGRGLLKSGATGKALIRYGQGVASDEYNNWMNRKSSLAGIGQTATNTTAAAGGQAATGIGNALIGSGTARASGYANEANAIGGGANSLAYLAGLYARR